MTQKGKIFSLLICLAVTPLAYGETVLQPGVIKGNGVNFRAEPGLESRVISVLKRGLTVEVIEENERWYKVQLADGQAGWIYREFVQLHPLYQSNSRERLTEAPVKEMIAYAKNFLGINYVYGGASPRGFDCSGFTKYVFSKIGIDLPHQAKQQMEKGTAIQSKTELLPGDLVFFKTKGSSIVNHVGIYLGDNRFIHASSGYGAVRISPLDSGYYYHRYVGARRLFSDGVNDEQTVS
ncbi:MAG: NlpC/P60 family protein [Bacteroidota bacterium]